MGRTVDKQHVHLLYETSIQMPHLSHESINKITNPCWVKPAFRYTRVTANKSPSVFMRTEKKNSTQGQKISVHSVHSLFIKIPAQTASNTSVRVFISAVQSDYPVPENIIFTWSWAGQPSEELPIVLMVWGYPETGVVAWPVTSIPHWKPMQMQQDPPHQNKGKMSCTWKKMLYLESTIILEKAKCHFLSMYYQIQRWTAAAEHWGCIMYSPYLCKLFLLIVSLVTGR